MENQGSKILKNLLSIFGITAYEFATKIGATPQSVGDILRGRTQKISLRMQEKICNKFTNVNPEYLRKGTGEPLVKTSPKVVQIAQDSHDISQCVHNNTRACDSCTLLREANDQIKRLLSIIERLQM